MPSYGVSDTVFGVSPRNQLGFVELYSEDEARKKGNVYLMLVVERILYVGKEDPRWRNHRWAVR